MNGSPAFYRSAAAFFFLSAAAVMLLNLIAPLLPTGFGGLAILLVVAALAWTGVIASTLRIYDWFARR